MNKSTLKTSFFKVIDKLPAGLGYGIYHKVQMALDGSMASKIVPNKKSYDKIVELLATQNESLVGKNVLEIGSGWMPMMPYFLHYFGKSKRVFSYDINEHYSNKHIGELNAYFKKEFNISVESKSGKKYALPEFIEYFPKQNVITAQLSSEIDLIFSRFVLEHVTPADMRAMHKKFYEDLEEEALVLHLISPSDHRAYSDKSLSHYDFLQYSEAEWNAIQTKFDYHNRMRLPQYLAIFEETGFEVIHLEYDKTNRESEKYTKYKKLKLHADYANFSEEEILAGSINVLLRKRKIKA